MARPKFTPTEQRFIDLLSDGLSHNRSEFVPLLYDELGRLATIRFHIMQIRRKLRPIGEDIVCEIPNGRTPHYRHVRLLHSAYKD